MSKSVEFVSIITKSFREEQVNELFLTQSVVISIFRFISPLARQFILRLIKLGTRKFSLRNWTLELELSTYAQDELIQFKVMRAVDPEHLMMNENFAKTLQRTFLNGYQTSFVEGKVVSGKEEVILFKEELKEFSKRNWRKLHEAIVGGSENPIFESSNNYKVLISSELCRKSFSEGKITEKGFHFILNTTSNQINTFLSEYCYFLIKSNKFSATKIFSFIFDLNLLVPYQAYYFRHKDCSPLQDYERIIINDFCELGLIWSKGELFHSTPLLWNFSYEKEQKDLDFTADIIVETNFKVYAYSVSDFILKLLEHFCEIKYRLPNLIIAVMTRESVVRAFKNNISAEQLIEFLNKNINPEKIQMMSQNTQKKQNSKLTEEDKKKPLEYLRLFSKEREKQEQIGYIIPDNIIQQLKLWEIEKKLSYSEGALEKAKIWDKMN